jgi:hypothetical protein
MRELLPVVFVLLVHACSPFSAAEEDVVNNLNKPTEEIHQDSRCVCKCPDVAIVVRNSKSVVVDVGGSSVR